MDAEAEQMAVRLDLINAALSLCNSIRQSRLLDQREYRLGIERGTTAGLGGVFVVKQAFQCMLDNEMFEPGQLVDQTLCGAGTIALQKVRKIMPVELETASAAA